MVRNDSCKARHTKVCKDEQFRMVGCGRLLASRIAAADSDEEHPFSPGGQFRA